MSIEWIYVFAAAVIIAAAASVGVAIKQSIDHNNECAATCGGKGKVLECSTKGVSCAEQIIWRPLK